MTWVSFTVPGCGSELDARKPTAVEVVGGADVTVTGLIADDCSFSFGLDCERVATIDGRFSMDGSAAVAGLLAVVVAGAGTIVFRGPTGFRLRAALGLCGALLMVAVATSPEWWLDMSWTGTAARPNVDAGPGPLCGAMLFSAAVCINVVFALWGRSERRRTLLIFKADVGFASVCVGLGFLATEGPAVLIFVLLVLAMLAAFVEAPKLQRPAAGRERVRLAQRPPSQGPTVMYTLFAALTVLMTTLITLGVFWAVAAGLQEAANRSTAERLPAPSVAPTPVSQRPHFNTPERTTA